MERVATAIPAESSFHPSYGDAKSTLRIRKLTPCECLRLMGFTKEDFLNMKAAGMSDSQIYHCAGDSIVTNCLVGIFGVLYANIDTKKLQQEWADICSEGI